MLESPRQDCASSTQLTAPAEAKGVSILAVLANRNGVNARAASCAVPPASTPFHPWTLNDRLLQIFAIVFNGAPAPRLSLMRPKAQSLIGAIAWLFVVACCVWPGVEGSPGALRPCAGHAPASNGLFSPSYCFLGKAL